MRVPRSPSLPRAAVSSLVAISASVRSRWQALFGLGHRALVIGDADLHRFDLGAERGDFGALAVGDQRAFAELAEKLCQFGFLVGEMALGFAQRARFDLEFILGGAELIAQRLVARFERKNGRGLFAELFLELVDGVGLLAELGQLRRGLGLHLLDAHFEPSGRHREFGAQLILVGADFGDRQRRRRFEALHRQAHGAVMHQRNEQQAEQRRDQKSDTEIHDRFDHDATPPGRLPHSCPPAAKEREGERTTMPCGCALHHIHRTLT